MRVCRVAWWPDVAPIAYGYLRSVASFLFASVCVPGWAGSFPAIELSPSALPSTGISELKLYQYERKRSTMKYHWFSVLGGWTGHEWVIKCVREQCYAVTQNIGKNKRHSAAASALSGTEFPTTRPVFRFVLTSSREIQRSSPWTPLRQKLSAQVLANSPSPLSSSLSFLPAWYPAAAGWAQTRSTTTSRTNHSPDL